MANRWWHPKIPLALRFSERVDRRGPDDCWPWKPGSSSRSGHGQISVNNRMQLAHRVAYQLAFGPIPPDMVVRHVCHEPICVNPAHLVVGTVAENNADTARRNRAVRRLIDAHPNEFRHLLRIEMAREVSTDVPDLTAFGVAPIPGLFDPDDFKSRRSA